jgi:hypothetical protein
LIFPSVWEVLSGPAKPAGATRVVKVGSHQRFYRLLDGGLVVAAAPGEPAWEKRRVGGDRLNRRCQREDIGSDAWRNGLANAAEPLLAISVKNLVAEARVGNRRPCVEVSAVGGPSRQHEQRRDVA